MTEFDFDPRPHLKRVLDAGHYEIVFRRGDQHQRVREHAEIDTAYEGSPSHDLVLHRPRHVFVQPDLLGTRFRQDGDQATIDLDGTEAVLSDIQTLPGEPTTLVGELDASGLDAYDVVHHPSLVVGESEEPAVSAVHGFRFFTHIAWFATLQGEPTETNPGVTAAPIVADIGLIDDGIDTQHSWLTNDVDVIFPDGADPGHPAGAAQHAMDDASLVDDAIVHHGTMVGGLLSTKGLRIKLCKVVLPQAEHEARDGVTVPDPGSHLADELQILFALDTLEAMKVPHALLPFGGHTFYEKSMLRRHVNAYVRNGGTLFASAGNLAPNEQRNPIYPAAFAKAIAVAGSPDGQSYYDWSNGWPLDGPSKGWKGTDINVTIAVPTDATDDFITTSYGTKGNPPVDLFVNARGTSLLAALAAVRHITGKGAGAE